ncbi:MAG: IS5 family transposase [Candidatus Sulfotelmatobacter sp.]
MRGNDLQQGTMFSYLSPEQRVPADHPLRPLRQMVDTVLKRLSPRFEAMYAEGGRPSIPPEKLLRALLLQCLYSVRSERLLMEQLDYNLLFRWFVGLNMDDAIWDCTVFSKNRERLLQADVAGAFFAEVGQLARGQGWLSDEHFTVDGTLIEAWAGQKSFQPKAGTPPPTDSDAGNPDVDFRGQKRSNDTHASTTDPDARLYKKAKGQEAKLAFLGHVLMENRHGLVVQTRLTRATGTAEREASLEMIGEKRHQKRGRLTLGGDKNYDTREQVASLRALKVTPHVAQNTGRPGGSALDQRTTRHAGYAVSQTKRKRVEEIFGWFKTVALMRKTRYRGLERVGWMFTWAAAAYNLVRMRNLLGATT